MLEAEKERRLAQRQLHQKEFTKGVKLFIALVPVYTESSSEQTHQKRHETDRPEIFIHRFAQYLETMFDIFCFSQSQHHRDHMKYDIIFA
jgi:hypothetical protein